jgi:hypothetical protein
LRQKSLGAGVEPARKDLRVVGIARFSFVLLGVPGALLKIARSSAIRETFALSLDAVSTLFLMGNPLPTTSAVLAAPGEVGPTG